MLSSCGRISQLVEWLIPTRHLYPLNHKVGVIDTLGSPKQLTIPYYSNYFILYTSFPTTVGFRDPICFLFTVAIVLNQLLPCTRLS